MRQGGVLICMYVCVEEVACQTQVDVAECDIRHDENDLVATGNQHGQHILSSS